MKREMIAAAAVGALLSGFAMLGWTDPTKPSDRAPAKAPEEKSPDEPSKPGPNHKWMAQLEGDWVAEVKIEGSDKGDKGEMTNKMEMGGRFLTMDYDGRYAGQFFHGKGMMGYNSFEKRFERAWADSASTFMAFGTGSVDASGKVLTLISDEPDEKTGKVVKVKEVLTITGKDTYKSVYTRAGAGGKDEKMLEATFTRKGKDAKKEDKK